jgi:hypothetical protein
VLENKTLKNIFGTKREAVTGGWRKLYDEQFHELKTTAYIIRVIKSRLIGRNVWQKLGRTEMLTGLETTDKTWT